MRCVPKKGTKLGAYLDLIFIFILGAMIGSFLNVIIYRLPRNIDFVFMRSHCTVCKKTIPFYFNIPVLGYLILRGKCSNCGERYSYKYPLVELFTAMAFVFIYQRFSLFIQPIEFIIYSSIFAVLVCIFFIDLEFYIIPNSLNLYLLSIFLLKSFLYEPLEFWLLGGFIGFFFPFMVTWLYSLLRGQIGLGMGDVKLYGVLGIFLGPLGITQNIFLSCFLGALIGGTLIVIKKMDRNTPIPFGPFIVLVAMFQIYFPQLFKKYLVLF